MSKQLLSADECERIAALSPDEKRAELANTMSELEPLLRHEKPTGAQAARIDELVERETFLSQEIRRDELNEVVRSGNAHLEPSTGPTGSARSIAVNRKAGGKAWEARDWSDDDEVRGRALEAVEDHGDAVVEHVRSVVEDHRHPREAADLAREILAGSDPAYLRAFGKMLRDPLMGSNRFTPQEWQAWERATMVVGTNANGGYMVPTHLDPSIIITNNGSSNVMRQIAKVVPLTAGNVWHGVASTGVTVSFDPELTEVSDDSPTLSQPSIPVYQAQGWVEYSVQSEDDVVDLATEIGRLIVDAKDRIEETKFSVGSGTAEPKGVWTAVNAVGSSIRYTSATAATIALQDIHGLYALLPARYRRQGSWLCNPKYSLAIKALGTALSASFSGDLRESTAGDILGRPLYESDDAPATQTTTALDNEVIFGDFSRFQIVDRVGLRVEFVPHVFNTANNRPDGRRGLYARWRTGSDVVDTNAFTILVDKTSA